MYNSRVCKYSRVPPLKKAGGKVLCLLLKGVGIIINTCFDWLLFILQLLGRDFVTPPCYPMQTSYHELRWLSSWGPGSSAVDWRRKLNREGGALQSVWSMKKKIMSGR